MNKPFDWENFQHQLKSQLPKLQQNSNVSETFDFSWIEEYVRNTIEESMGQIKQENTAKPSKKTTSSSSAPKTTQIDQNDDPKEEHLNLKTELFEIHNFVIVKVIVPEQLNPRRIRCALNDYRLSIRVLPQKKAQIINLPCNVLSSKYKARFKERFIEIQLPKDPLSEPFHPIKISYIND